MKRCCHGRRRVTRSAFTLTELLIAATIALVVMAALASLLGVFSRAGTNSQSIVEMSSRMRSVAARLRQDLGGITAPLTPPLSPEAGLGYFEVVEGPMQDGIATTSAGVPLFSTTASATSSILADTDDALIFTTRSLSGPFEGRYGNTQIESNTAEVAWFCRPSANQPFPDAVQLQTLYRRQLLVAGYVGASPFFTAGSPTNNQINGTLPAAYATYDISLRSDPTAGNALVPNTLADLTQRENRFFHGPLRTTAFPNSTTNLTFDGTGREGEDIVLTNVIAFDVRVFDPAATPRLNGSAIVYPPEQGYAALTTTGTFSGCFVDLGRCPGGTVLSGSAATGTGLTATYDTWSTFYENNGLNDGGTAAIDDGADGIDNNLNGIPDDPGEAEAPPPYAVPLRAVEIRIRCLDPTSREIRQLTVRQAFTN
jgi:hypothetical protein